MLKGEYVTKITPAAGGKPTMTAPRDLNDAEVRRTMDLVFRAQVRDQLAWTDSVAVECKGEPLYHLMRARLYRELLIGVTRFFRDAAAFELGETRFEVAVDEAAVGVTRGDDVAQPLRLVAKRRDRAVAVGDVGQHHARAVLARLGAPAFGELGALQVVGLQIGRAHV